MAGPFVYDRIQEATTSIGTGPVALGGAEAGGFFTFSSVLTDGQQAPYAIQDTAHNDVEVGIGTYVAAGNLWARTTVLRSTNGNALVNFQAGTKDVYIDVPALYLAPIVANQAAGTVFAGPVSGPSAQAAFRALTATDLLTIFPVSDSTVLLADDLDATKQLRIEIGGFTSGNTRVLTPQDASYIIAGTNLANIFTLNQTAPAWVASGLTGAVQASRYVGATASAAPVAGTFALGDFVIDQTGKIWICTTAGTPGTWTQVGGASLPVSDSTSLLFDDADATKLLRFEIGGFTTGTTRVLTPQDASYIIAGTNLANVFTLNQTAPAWVASGLTGAVQASRYVGATASAAPVAGTFALGDFVIDQTGKIWICTTAGTPGTWTQVGGASLPVSDSTSLLFDDADATKLLRFEIGGFTTGTTRVLTPQDASYIIAGTNLANTFTLNQTAPAWVASGLTGAVQASRYVGATAAAAPVAGTFALGDFVIDQTGKIWICTTAGTPGTWTQVGGGGGALPVSDSTIIVQDDADATKQLRFEIGGFTTANTRVLTPQDASYILAGTNIPNNFSGQQVFKSSGDGNKAVIIQPHSSGQSPDIFECQYSTGAAGLFFSTNHDGANSDNGGFVIQDKSGSQLFQVNNDFGVFSAEFGNVAVHITHNSVTVASDGAFTWSNSAGSANAGADTNLSRPSAGLLRIGAIGGTGGLKCGGAGSAGTSVAVEKVALMVCRNATDTPIAGMGVSYQAWLDSTTTPEQPAMERAFLWQNPTDASRQAQLIDSIFDTVKRETIRYDTDGTGPNVSFFSAVARGAQGTYGGGRKMIFINNAQTNPSSNPTAGGLLYANGGAGTWRGSGGTVTAFGPAGPHCGSCGADFWKICAHNDNWNAHIRECAWCGAIYRKGPATFFHLLTQAQKQELIYE
jgi:hypothetical protein